MEREERAEFEHEEKERFDDLVIFTTTLYGDDESSKIRSELALQLFENARKLNIRCVVVDGGSNEYFMRMAQSFKNVYFLINIRLGMGESRRAALQSAIERHQADYYLWVEPEKEGLISENSLSAMIEQLRGGSADIVVPQRKSKETLPKFQAWIETWANKRASDLYKDRAEEEIYDLWFGPKIFNREGARYFLEYKGELDKWDAIIKPILEAKRDGKKIVSVPVDFHYNENQRRHEEGSKSFKQKRVDQYKQILAELGDDFWRDKS